MSAAWQPLPEALPPEVRQLVEQLRLLKDRTGLSLVALGKETAYSRSSWQRYLSGRQPPPRQAVAELCRVAGEDSERLCAHREMAVRAWPQGGAGDAGSAPGVVLSKAGEDVPSARPGRPRRPPRPRTSRARPSRARPSRARPSRARSSWTWRSAAGVTVFLVLVVLLEGLLRYFIL
ncbi:helix-turn-helix transcriptional regulator [Streptomyces sp. NPDC047525]|uniref:helix-turn-helix domain-containing protein n=1 Tax=Streptomyces sp. NPDC047525 TaxID=3155264 RepID=UPI0033FBD2C2